MRGKRLRVHRLNGSLQKGRTLCDKIIAMLFCIWYALYSRLPAMGMAEELADHVVMQTRRQARAYVLGVHVVSSVRTEGVGIIVTL